MESQVQRAADVSEDPLQGRQVRLTRVMHVEADLLNGVRDVGPGEGEVLQCTGETPKVSGIHHRRTVVGGELGGGVDRGVAGLAVRHAGMLESVDAVLSLT
jgi:multidrug efflux pump subunit AcrA (membrane-fusion protein)